MSWIHAAEIRTKKEVTAKRVMLQGEVNWWNAQGQSVSSCPNLTIWHMDFRSLLYTVDFHSRLFATAYGDVTCVGFGLMLKNFSLVTTKTIYCRHSTFSKHSTKQSELPTKTVVNSTNRYFVSNRCYQYCCEGPASRNEIFCDRVATADVPSADS